jgi:hypothetical protein
MEQGFVQLQLTPIAVPASQLIDRLSTVVLDHATTGRIIQTKWNPDDIDLPIRVNVRRSLWIWENVRKALDTPEIFYLPAAYSDRDHQGLTKEEVMRDTRLCAVPGWSIGLIEPIPIMPPQGQGKIIGGRSQLEASSTPHEYLCTLSTPTYQGEAGWTPEDLVTHFVTQLEATNQVSHDRSDGNALWLLGAYLPYSGPGLAKLVLVGYWARVSGRMEISAHRSANRLRGWVARSMVRLGI